MPARSEFNRGLHFSIRLYASLSYRYPTLRRFAAAPPPPSSLASDTVIVWPPTDIAMFSPMKIAFCADSASAKTTETLGGRSCERSVSKPPSHKHRQRQPSNTEPACQNDANTPTDVAAAAAVAAAVPSQSHPSSAVSYCTHARAARRTEEFDCALTVFLALQSMTHTVNRRTSAARI